LKSAARAGEAVLEIDEGAVRDIMARLARVEGRFVRFSACSTSAAIAMRSCNNSGLPARLSSGRRPNSW